MKKKINIAVLILSVMVAILVGWTVQSVYVSLFDDKYQNNFNSIFPQYLRLETNLSKEENRYYSLTNDPQLLFELDCQWIDAVKVNFVEPLVQEMNITVYYANNEGFSQDRSSARIARRGAREVVIDIPDAEYTKLRVDIGSLPNQTFILKNIETTQSLRKNVSWGVLIISFVLLTVMFYSEFEHMNMSRKRFILVFMLLLGCTCALVTGGITWLLRFGVLYVLIAGEFLFRRNYHYNGEV